MQLSPRSFTSVMAPLILAASLFLIYWGTLAPGLSWANNGSDGGDLITAAATGGVPHPSGYPLYLLLARLFQFLPVGSLAFRTNLMSAIATVLAAVLVYKIVTFAQLSSGGERGWLPGLLAGYAFGLAPLIWSQAVITEVYALQALLIALILYLYSGQTDNRGLNVKHLDCLRGLVVGLAVGNHVTAILVLPAAVLMGSLQRPTVVDGEHSRFGNLQLDTAALLRQLGCLAVGLSLYVILPLRAAEQPPVNWGNLVTLDRFWWLVSGQVYQSYYLGSGLPQIAQRIQQAATLLLAQFGLPALLLGLTGLIVFWRVSRLSILMAWTASVYLGFAVCYGSADWQVYLIPAFLCFSIWIGLGLAGLIHQWQERSSFLKTGLALLMIGYLGVRSVNIAPQVDASQDGRAESFGREVLSRAPPHAILFADGDPAIFALWYFHFALGERPDVAVLAVDLLHFDWYQETLRSTYPALVVPGPFPWPETIASANPARAACYVEYSDQTEIDCSELTTLP